MHDVPGLSDAKAEVVVPVVERRILAALNAAIMKLPGGLMNRRCGLLEGPGRTREGAASCVQRLGHQRK